MRNAYIRPRKSADRLIFLKVAFFAKTAFKEAWLICIGFIGRLSHENIMELPVSTAFDSTLHGVESDKWESWKNVLNFRANSADDWFQNLISIVKEKVEEERCDIRVRVAILDTGVDESNSCIRAALDENVIVKCKGFPQSRDPIRDMHGHGTHGASILIKVAPFVELYVARIADDHGHLEEDELGNEYVHIAEVIRLYGAF